MSGSSLRGTLVVGPAYLDRVLRLDDPLVASEQGGPLDRSQDGRLVDKAEIEGIKPDLLTIADANRSRLVIAPPTGWPGPFGMIRLDDPLLADDLEPGWTRRLQATAWEDDLGGMGAGYAAAFEGTLISAVGPPDDPVTLTIQHKLAEVSTIAHSPIVMNHPADWTLLVTSGRHGDKLPIGFRGCHAALENLGGSPSLREPADLLVVASLPNRLLKEALHRSHARIRLCAPALRNMRDRQPPLGMLADRIDILTCNQHEWDTLDVEDRRALERRVAVIAVTRGAEGVTVSARSGDGSDRAIVDRPAFPRRRPPLDTNRAGECFGATLARTLIEADFDPRVPPDPEAVAHAATTATIGAALVLDRIDFGFPTAEQIEVARQRGFVP